MKRDINAMMIIFFLVLIAYKCKGQDSLSWVCNSNFEYVISDQEYLTGHIVSGAVSLTNITADSFKITVRDSFKIENCTLGHFEVEIYDCTAQSSATLEAIDWLDSALMLIYQMRLATEALDQDSCHISGKANLHLQIANVSLMLTSLIEARDSIEAGATGRNLELFNFFKPQIQADLNQIEDYAQRYVALLYSDTCEHVENRLHGRLDFILDSLFRLNQNFNSLKNGWL